MSWSWSWSQIQSLASWYYTACCRTMILSISWVWAWENLHWVMRVDIQVDRAWIPSSADTGKKFVPEIPEMLLNFYSSANGIKGFTGLLVLCRYGPIVSKGLESLSIFALEHHLQLLPVSVLVIRLISIDVESFQVI